MNWLQNLLRWLLNRRPNCQVFCPGCRNDMMSCEQSKWDFEGDDDAVAVATCGQCATTSRWLFAAPVPIRLT